MESTRSKESRLGIERQAVWNTEGGKRLKLVRLEVRDSHSQLGIPRERLTTHVQNVHLDKHLKMDNKCTECPVGTYQDEEGQRVCEMCPLDTSTIKTGTIDVSHCVKQCPPGHYSDSGYNEKADPCMACPKGTYTWYNGTVDCTPCPEGSTTLQEGSTDEEQCIRPPKISSVASNMGNEIKDGQEVELQCYFAGMPYPRAEWKKLSGSMNPDNILSYDIYDINVNRIGVALVIFAFHPSDAGNYRCEIENAIGRNQMDIKISLKS